MSDANERAKTAGVTILREMGLDPGIGMVTTCVRVVKCVFLFRCKFLIFWIVMMNLKCSFFFWVYHVCKIVWLPIIYISYLYYVLSSDFRIGFKVLNKINNDY